MHENPTPVLVVAGALVSPEGRVCIQQRPAGKAHGGLWEFPGGKIERGEAPAAALCRELAEELGVGIEPAALSPCGFAAGEGVVILLYVCRRWRGEAAALEGGAIAWVEPARISALPMPPLDYPLAEQVVRLMAAGLI